MVNKVARMQRAEQMLAELAELGLSLARDLAARATAAGDPEQKAALADAARKVSDEARESLALQAKLGRQVACDAAEAAQVDAPAEAPLAADMRLLGEPVVTSPTSLMLAEFARLPRRGALH